MRYISVKQIDNYLEGKSYNTIHKTGSVRGMKNCMDGITQKKLFIVVNTYTLFFK